MVEKNLDIEKTETGPYNVNTGRIEWVRIQIANIRPSEMEAIHDIIINFCKNPSREPTGIDHAVHAVSKTERKDRKEVKRTPTKKREESLNMALKRLITSELKESPKTKGEVTNRIIMGEKPGSKKYMAFHSAWSQMVSQEIIISEKPKEKYGIWELNPKEAA